VLFQFSFLCLEFQFFSIFLLIRFVALQSSSSSYPPQTQRTARRRAPATPASEVIDLADIHVSQQVRQNTFIPEAVAQRAPALPTAQSVMTPAAVSLPVTSSIPVVDHVHQSVVAPTVSQTPVMTVVAAPNPIPATVSTPAPTLVLEPVPTAIAPVPQVPVEVESPAYAAEESYEEPLESRPYVNISDDDIGVPSSSDDDSDDSEPVPQTPQNGRVGRVNGRSTGTSRTPKPRRPPGSMNVRMVEVNNVISVLAEGDGGAKLYPFHSLSPSSSSAGFGNSPTSVAQQLKLRPTKSGRQLQLTPSMILPALQGFDGIKIHRAESIAAMVEEEERRQREADELPELDSFQHASSEASTFFELPPASPSSPLDTVQEESFDDQPTVEITSQSTPALNGILSTSKRGKASAIPHFKATAVLDFSNLMNPNPTGSPKHVGFDFSDDESDTFDEFDDEDADAVAMSRHSIEEQWRNQARTAGWHVERSASANALNIEPMTEVRQRHIVRSTLSEPVLSTEKQKFRISAHRDEDDDYDDDYPATSNRFGAFFVCTMNCLRHSRFTVHIGETADYSTESTAALEDYGIGVVREPDVFSSLQPIATNTVSHAAGDASESNPADIETRPTAAPAASLLFSSAKSESKSKMSLSFSDDEGSEDDVDAGHASPIGETLAQPQALEESVPESPAVAQAAVFVPISTSALLSSLEVHSTMIGAWTASNMGGAPGENFQNSKFWLNPTYRIRPVQRGSAREIKLCVGICCTELGQRCPGMVFALVIETQLRKSASGASVPMTRIVGQACSDASGSATGEVDDQGRNICVLSLPATPAAGSASISTFNVIVYMLDEPNQLVNSPGFEIDCWSDAAVQLVPIGTTKSK
jgi:hypothetical protein